MRIPINNYNANLTFSWMPMAIAYNAFALTAFQDDMHLTTIPLSTLNFNILVDKNIHQSYPFLAMSFHLDPELSINIYNFPIYPNTTNV